MSHPDRAGANRSRRRRATSRPEASSRSIHARTLTVVLVFITVVLTTLALEAATRFLYHDITTTGDNRSYFARRWREQHPPSVNEYGFRERDFPVPRPENIYRIAVIGDSFTYGQGILEEDRMTNLLDSYLNMNYPKPVFEVLNFGRPGTDTDKHVEFLANSVIHIDANFVILQWFVNDVRDRDLRYSTIPLVPWPRLHRFMISRSALFYLIDYGWIQLQYYLGLIESEDDFMVRLFGDIDSRRAKRARDLLVDFIQICRRNNLPLGIILFPVLKREQPLGFLLDRVLKVCVDRQINCVDLRKTFASVKDPANLSVNQFDGHPNRRANELAARAVLDAFGAQWAAHADRILKNIDQTGG